MNNVANIPPPVTFVKIWTILNMYWDFLNYGLLEHVINKCGSEDLKQQMQDYVDELSTLLAFVISSRAGHAEMMDHQKTISKRWLSKWDTNGPSVHYTIWSHSINLSSTSSFCQTFTFSSKMLRGNCRSTSQRIITFPYVSR